MKIKLTYIISGLNFGGAQKLLLDSVSILRKKHPEIEITVISIRYDNLIPDFEKLNVKVYNLNKYGLFNVSIFFKILKILREIKPDIVHTHILTADFYGRIAAKIAGVKNIYSTCHNNSTNHKKPDESKKQLTDFIDNFTINFTNSKVIAISELIERYLVKRMHGAKEKIKLIYNGIDPRKSNYSLNFENIENQKKELNLGLKDFIISIIGRLEIQKGHLFFLDSLKDIILINNLKILIIGEGSLKGSIEKFIVSNNLNNNVFIFPPRKNVEMFFEISDIIAVPSLWEAFGLVVVEGMIKKKIVLASDVGAIPEIINDGINGFLFKSENIDSLRKKFEYIYKNFNNFSELKENAKFTVLEKFNIEKNVEELYSFYMNELKKIKVYG